MEARGAGVKQLQHAHVYIHSGSYKISIKRLPLFNIAASCCPTIDASLGVGMVGGVKALYAVLLALVLGVGLRCPSLD